MGMTKRDLSKKNMNLKTALEELQKKAKSDPLKRNTALHEEIAKLQRKLAED